MNTEQIAYFDKLIQNKLEQLPRAIEGKSPIEVLEKICQELRMLKYAKEQLALCNVVGRSEQLSCSTCKWLKRTDDYCDTCFKFKKHEPTT